MLHSVNTRFPPTFFAEIDDKQKSASLLPVLACAKVAANESDFLASEEVTTLSQMHSHQVEGVRNLCLNIFRKKDDLADCETDIQLYHKVYSVHNLFVGASHVLANIAKIICSSPPESVVESMGSIVEKIPSSTR